jgi:hypothetical protein
VGEFGVRRPATRCFNNLSPCSLGLSATSQQYFSLRTNQPSATSQNQPAVFFSQNKPAPAISHQPTEQAVFSSSYNTIIRSSPTYSRKKDLFFLFLFLPSVLFF